MIVVKKCSSHVPTVPRFCASSFAIAESGWRYSILIAASGILGGLAYDPVTDPVMRQKPLSKRRKGV